MICGRCRSSAGQPVLAHGGAKLLAARARRKRDVDHVRGRIVEARIGIERMLERRHHQHPRIAREDVLGAVAVMDVEIDDRHALDPVDLERVRRAHRDVVEEAEAHRAVALRVVAGRADRAERRAAFAAHDEVGGEHDGARRVPGRRQRMRVHRGVGIEVVQAGLRAFGLDRRDVASGRGRGRSRRRRPPGPNDGRDSCPVPSR